MISKNTRAIGLGLIFGLLFSLTSWMLPAAKVKAASASNLVISEINWAGSAGSLGVRNTNDQWIELYNQGNTSIDFSVTPYQLKSGAATITTISSGTIGSLKSFLISRIDNSVAGSGSTLDSVNSLRDLYAPTLVIPTIDSQITLVDQTSGQVVDTAGNGSGPQFAGNDGTGGDGIIASMSRVLSPLTEGNLKTSWKTANTIGGGFAGGVTQYGTPKISTSLTGGNPEVNISSNLFSLDSTTPNQPIISGSVDSTVAGVSISIYHPGNPNVVVSATPTLTPNPVTLKNDFSYTVPTLNAGLYQIFVFLNDGDTPVNISATVPVLIADSPQNIYVVPTAFVDSVAKPTLTPSGCDYLLIASKCITKDTSIQLNGVVNDVQSNLIVSINGNNYSSTSPDINGAFSVSISLLKDQQNSIEVRAKDAAGSYSTPAVAYIIQDSTAPVIDKSFISISSNLPGKVDTISGLAGSVLDANQSYLDIYADQNKTTLINSVTIAADGSFAATSIGDNQYATVYLVARDAAGNISAVSGPLNNTISFAAQVPAVIKTAGPDSLSFTWGAVTGASYYILKYAAVGGTYSAPANICQDKTIVCTTTWTLIGLSASTGYQISLVAVDQFGNISAPTVTTLTTAAPVVVTPTVTEVVATPAPAPLTTTIPAPVYTPTPSVAISTPTPTPEPAKNETGQVKSANTDDTNKNWTPWIILLVLIILAVLATTGYFYWFGGEAGDVALASVLAEKSRLETKEDDVSGTTDAINSDAKTKKTVNKPTEAAPIKKEPPKEKRW